MNMKIYTVLETSPLLKVYDAYKTKEEAKQRIDELKKEHGSFKCFSIQIVLFHA